jgi:hypothetical protein
MTGRQLVVVASLALCFAAGACRRTSARGACATPSSFEAVFVTLNPGYPPKAAPDDPSAWRVVGRPFFCTEHIAAVSAEQTEFGAELILTTTEEGHRSLRDATTGQVGERIMIRIEGLPHSVAVLQSPLDVKVLRVTMGWKVETATEGFNARLRAELARRAAP